MLNRILTTKIKRPSRSASSNHSQEPTSSSAHAPHTSSKMGNAPSTQNSPNRKAGSIGRSSTLSSSVGMPGAEPPRVDSPLKEGMEESTETTANDEQAGSQNSQKPTDEVLLLIPPVAPETDAPAKVEQPEASVPNGNSLKSLSRQESTDSQRQIWLPGTHVLLNARSGTALDLCGADQRNLIGFPVNMGPNQQWEFIPSGKGYMIRSACPSSCGLYLTVEELREGAPIVASSYPVSWNVDFAEKVEDAIRISWPNTNFVIDLADWGNATPGTKVELMHAKPGELCQLWRFTRCALAKEQEEKIARTATKPVIAETIIVSEGKEHIITTRTTTTTTVTTVTTVTRTPRPQPAVNGSS
ncbi:uncharacterized protein C8Q71DRAFT_746087 [Rhodofomes roseus]|uniref:Ricin-type beta-trefoil lectin protein n=1 Tax=Rhodofomes roseus TaxID=34475 RepID=A0A4Y9XR77_9APHY|nr:uncharacterized protein C8Q71DRAFT_746087 [Rhodofomes roseus]KAH9840164.1 hypothetical protein C8Q71DRAFT_746087 [Rhodofomes roseus]TFY52576.1 hypothetical protein EVJ58_g9938 [Rhodofomes roseus]